MVFINGKVTARLIRSQLIREDILTARRLYQYLNWTMRISKVAETMTIMEGRTGRKVLLFDVELHDQRGEGLYALCVPNDVQSPNAQQWQLADLLTAHQLTHLLRIDSRELPGGVRAVSSQFEQFRMMESVEDTDRLKGEIMAIDDRLNRLRYYRLKCIRTGNGKKSKKWQDEGSVLKVKLSTFYEKVHDALMDENVALIPIVSIVSRRNRDLNEKEENFSVDYLLPIEIQSNWVGVVYRKGQCAMALMDKYDISNKAILCDPSFDVKRLDFFQNEYNRLKIVMDDDEEQKSSESNESTTWTPPTLSLQSFPSSDSCAAVSALSLNTYSNRSPSSSLTLTPRSVPPMTPLSERTVTTPLSPISPNMEQCGNIQSLAATRWMQWNQYTERVIQDALRHKIYFEQFLTK